MSFEGRTTSHTPIMAKPPGRSLAQRWIEVDRANRLLRVVSDALNFVAEPEGWPVPFSPVRFLVLAHLHHATTFGLTPRRLAWLLRMPASSLAHHLDVLEGAEMIDRRPRDLHDRRAVTVRLTPWGRAAYLRLGAQTIPDASPRVQPGVPPV
jgi:DNA-binding MarR family transcriptional regulator